MLIKIRRFVRKMDEMNGMECESNTLNVPIGISAMEDNLEAAYATDIDLNNTDDIIEYDPQAELDDIGIDLPTYNKPECHHATVATMDFSNLSKNFDVINTNASGGGQQQVAEERACNNADPTEAVTIAATASDEYVFNTIIDVSEEVDMDITIDSQLESSNNDFVHGADLYNADNPHFADYLSIDESFKLPPKLPVKNNHNQPAIRILRGQIQHFKERERHYLKLRDAARAECIELEKQIKMDKYKREQARANRPNPK